jgi:hypothetical protein
MNDDRAALIECARAALVNRWPEQAAELHDLLSAYAFRYEARLTKDDSRRLLARVDQLAGALPSEAAEIVRLAKLAYTIRAHTSDQMYQTELREACLRLQNA